ncbi:hypothetical protein KKF59_02430 [Patescibacteria group bacterium]|nr:hypothetical protein [Patescibacteria group bacterium]MBU1034173.1 hypothetical protein [Patescibacteria group bacterium]MBU1629882.1 hypothetical protein [Patescibacteria group bacterium]MBU1907967.1 hypothetical protein [Patescibacteria group bacterium]
MKERLNWIVSIVFVLLTVTPAQAAFIGPSQPPPLGNVPGVIWNIPAANPNSKQSATEYNVAGSARIGGDYYMGDGKALRVDFQGNQDTSLNIGNWGPKSFTLNVIGDIKTDNTDGADGRVSAYEFCYLDALGNPKDCLTTWPSGGGGGPYVQLSGDTMTGVLTLSGDPIGPLDAVTKQYVDDLANGDGEWPFVLLSGDIMTGLLTLSGDPVGPLDAATKQYVDDVAAHNGGEYVQLSGDTMTGILTLSGDPIGLLDAATKQYVDNATGGVTGPFVQISGDTMTGDLLLNTDPTQALQAATKQYVDNIVSGGGGPFVQLGGDTMTGILTLSGNPVAPLDAATKQYVDNSSGVKEVDTGFGLTGGPITNMGTIRVDQPELDAIYVNVPGDTMTGMLQVIPSADAISIYAKTGTAGGVGVKAEANQYAGWFVGDNYGIYSQTSIAGSGTAVRGFNGSIGGSFQGTAQGVAAEGTGVNSEGGNFRGNKTGVFATGKLEGVKAVIETGETGDALIGIGGSNGAKLTGSRYGADARGDLAGVFGIDNNQTGFGYVGYGDTGIYGNGINGVYGVGGIQGVYGENSDSGIYGKVGFYNYSFFGNGDLSIGGDVVAGNNQPSSCSIQLIPSGSGTFQCNNGKFMTGVRKNASNVVDGLVCCEF